MHKDLFNLFGYVVQTHAVISLLAIILGYGVALALTKNTIFYNHLKAFILYGVIGAIIGARIWHVFIFQWPTYSRHPIQIFEVWNGGISIEGAVAGGIVSLIIYSKYHRISFLQFADYLSPAMILAQGIGRIACFMNGDAFGKPTGGNFGLVYPKGTIAYDYYGSQPLWPAEVWESQGDMILFCVLFMISKFYGNRLGKGWLFSIYVAAYFVERFILEFFRGDSPRYGKFTGGQWSAIGIVALDLIFMIYLIVRDRRLKVNFK
ncbi:prolipoprotein diacylglyceryl transferase [Pullulanibacillus sp. KACC 23026]|uniref:prolipoprotein diacylglyceryl transferase n=1 Tax=Pullulanibacillus sp. KACC 23026 TaxID=3028315 RepID=UPI0023B06812|nr:prolipoprotein diacylglyceryl transferase [Pullulanibacillus sp. KACC 23026]WEG12134.1 prolipoprotein diacylglyceryl transferase [Pullulanibacillus sp. KACC 23026]